MHIGPWMRSMLVATCTGAATAGPAIAFTISFSSNQFTVSPSFNSVTAFDVEIDVAEPLATGLYLYPTINTVRYSVTGALVNPTPSGFPGFNLQRSMTGAEFYAQGSLLVFEIAANADLGDGLQMSELAPFLSFNAREVGTGRYHPPYLQLYADGSGAIQNSNNSGGVNPVTQQVVNVGFGDEYLVYFSANNPAALTLASPIPEPPAFLMLVAGLLGIGLWRIRRGARD